MRYINGKAHGYVMLIKCTTGNVRKDGIVGRTSWYVCIVEVSTPRIKSWSRVHTPVHPVNITLLLFVFVYG